MKITQITGREIFDSRGLPTIECELILDNEHGVIASVPSGISMGKHEAVELRDGGTRLDGKGVTKAIENIEQTIAPALIGKEPNVVEADMKMITLDNTENKSKLGANAILAVSYAVCKAQAAMEGMESFELLADICDIDTITLPVPFVNVINGGLHADNNLTFQEFMIVPSGQTVRGAIESCATFTYELKAILQKNKKSTLVGDEGGFAPDFKNEHEALDMLVQTMEIVKKKYDHEYVLAIDVAANTFYNAKTKTYNLHDKQYSTDELIAFYEELTKKYPIFSIEDGLSEDDWAGWKTLTKKLGEAILLVGDDLFTTNEKRIERGIKEKAGNTVLIKPNQIGTITETLQAMVLCKEHELATIVSHRSGETEDTFIIDLAIGTNAGQIKIGGMSRGERIAKYNQLMRIEDRLSRSMLQE